ncbi:MAG: DnaJ family domain-containing protein [Acidiferrobacterales bacterium]
MCFLNKIAEARIREAMERGEFDDLPGAGKPLALDDDSVVPEEMRSAYRILKNSGYMPRELEVRREIANVEHLIVHSDDGLTRTRGFKRLNYLMAQLQAPRGTALDFRVEQAYYDPSPALPDKRGGSA